MTTDYTLFFSLLSIGFFGGFSHCIGMCGPFVIAQISSNFQKIPLEDFSKFKKLKGLALIPYHLGRISTYTIIGFFCSLLSQNIQSNLNFRLISAIPLFLAALFFLQLFFEKKILRFKSRFLEKVVCFFANKASFFLQNAQGIRGYFLGIVLGFIPCGLLYGAFLIAAAISSPLLAALGMMSFGIATFPALFFTAISGHVLIKLSQLRFIAKTVILVNSITLLLMAIKLVF